MDSRKLELLITAAELGSFTKTAEAMSYTQSGLTHMMDALEKEVGFPLLIRGHSGVRLTKQGEELMPAIRRFLQANSSLENQIQRMKQQEDKEIRIAAYSSIAMHWLPEVLYRFHRECPKAEVNLRMVDHALEPQELLEQGKADVIFSSRYPKDTCDWIPLYEDVMNAVLPKNFHVTQKDYFPIENFQGVDFLMPYGNFDIDVNAALEKAGVKPHIKPAYVDDETVIRMVERGLGVSMMTELMIRGRSGNVQCLPIRPHTVREIGMGLPAKRQLSQEILNLKNCVISYVKESESSCFYCK